MCNGTFTRSFSLRAQSVVDFLNEIGQALDRAFKKHSSSDRKLPTLKRLWTGQFYTTFSLPDHNRSPPVLLVNTNHIQSSTMTSFSSLPLQPHWDDIYSVAHVLIHPRLDQFWLSTHDLYAYILFLHQHRRWTPMIMLSQEQCILSVTTRESQQFSSINLNLNHPPELALFIRVITSLMFLDDDAVGFGADLERAEGHFDVIKWDQIKSMLTGRERDEVLFDDSD